MSRYCTIGVVQLGGTGVVVRLDYQSRPRFLRISVADKFYRNPQQSVQLRLFVPTVLVRDQHRASSVG